MRASTQFLFLATVALCLSACIPPPPGSGDAAIFKRPNRYGWGSQRGEAKPAEPAPGSQRSGNRFGHNGSDSSNSNARNSNSNNSGSSQANNTRKPKPDTSRSNDRDDDNDRPGSGSNDSGNSSSSSSNDSADKKKDMADSSSSDSGPSSTSGSSSNKSTSTPPSNLNSYPYARLVPGKKGFVTLPGSNSSIGEIDVTGIKPGTPVEINDPRDASKKIYFRVP